MSLYNFASRRKRALRALMGGPNAEKYMRDKDTGNVIDSSNSKRFRFLKKNGLDPWNTRLKNEMGSYTTEYNNATKMRRKNNKLGLDDGHHTWGERKKARIADMKRKASKKAALKNAVVGNDEEVKRKKMRKHILKNAVVK